MSAKIQKKYLLGEFELDTGLYSLSREGIPVALSRKRFQVLLYLVEERQRLVTRKELLDRFWEGHEVYEENLTKCISEIRKALDDQHKPHRFIETLPAVGYRYIGTLEERVTHAGGPAETVHAEKNLPVVSIRAPQPIIERQFIPWRFCPSSPSVNSFAMSSSNWGWRMR